MSFYINEFKKHLQQLSDQVDHPYDEPARRHLNNKTTGSLEEAYQAMNQSCMGSYQRPAPVQLNEQAGMMQPPSMMIGGRSLNQGLHKSQGGVGSGTYGLGRHGITPRSGPQGPAPTPPAGGGSGGGPDEWEGTPYLEMVTKWFGSPVPPAPAWLDFDGDGVIGVDDLLFVLQHGGATAG